MDFHTWTLFINTLHISVNVVNCNLCLSIYTNIYVTPLRYMHLIYKFVKADTQKNSFAALDTYTGILAEFFFTDITMSAAISHSLETSAK